MREEHTVQVIETPGNPVASGRDPRSPTIPPAQPGQPGHTARRRREDAVIRTTGLTTSWV